MSHKPALMDTMRSLRPQSGDCGRRERAHCKLNKLSCVWQARLAQFSDEIQESLAQAEALGETGNVDGAQACVANTERLKVRTGAAVCQT